MSILWLTFLNIFAGIFIAFVFFGGRTRRMGHALDAHTFPELLGRRFQSRFVQMFSGLVIFVFMPLYAAAVIMGISAFLQAQLNISYEAALFVFTAIVAIYVIMGGLKGVMYTDALQGTLMLIGMVVFLVLTYKGLGGIGKAHAALAALDPGGMAAAGHRGWMSMPELGSQFWWTVVSTIVMGVGIGVLAQPQLAVRFMTVKSKRELNRAVLVGGIFILAMTGIAFVVGSLTNVYFVRDPEFGKISIAAAGSVKDIIPAYISNYMPWWFGLVFLVTLLAASMSTVSSQFHAIGTSLGRDVCEQLQHGQRSSVLVNRLAIFAAFCVTVILAYLLPLKLKAGEAIIARATAIFFGLCAATFLPAYLGGLYSRGMSRAAAIWGMVAGFASSSFWLIFGHLSESQPLLLCEKLFGKPSLVVNMLEGKAVTMSTGLFQWAYVDPLLIGLPVAVIVTLVVAAMTRALPEEHLKKCFPGK